jgi:shikimate kinase
MCSSDKDTFNYVKLWIAHFKNGRKMTTCLYLKGTQGAGKSSISNFLMDVLGVWNCHKTQNPNCLTSNFNGELDSKLLLILEELRCDSIHSWEAMNSSLNNLITENTMNIEKKYKDAILISNHLSVIITSNNSPIKMDKNDRRYLMSDVSNHRAKDEEYFKTLYSFMKNDIIQKAFYFNCKTIANETKFNEAPELQKVNTDAKTEVIIKNLHPFYKYVKEEYVLKCKDFNVFLKDLVSNYNMLNDSKRDINNIEISRLLKEIHITGKASTGNKHRYTVPHKELHDIFIKLNWMHQMDEFETDKHDPYLNVNYKEEIQKLKDENEKLKKQLEEKSFLSDQIEQVKKTISDIKEDIQLISAQRNDHELIKTITPDNSPKKSAPLFPRPVKKEPSNHHPITDMFDKDVISKIFIF